MIEITEKAAKEINRIITEQELEEDENLYLRLRVVGGGCSGFMNKLDLDPNMDPKFDCLFEEKGVKIVVDKRSMIYLENATIDFSDDLNRRGFIVNNPDIKTSCGCGSSFSM